MERNTAGYHDSSSLEGVLHHIKDMYGLAAFGRDGIGLSCLKDCAPNLACDYRVLRHFQELGIFDAFTAVNWKDENIRHRTMNRYLTRLICESCMIPEKAGCYMEVLVHVYGWNFPVVYSQIVPESGGGQEQVRKKMVQKLQELNQNPQIGAGVWEDGRRLMAFVADIAPEYAQEFALLSRIYQEAEQDIRELVRKVSRGSGRTAFLYLERIRRKLQEVYVREDAIDFILDVIKDTFRTDLLCEETARPRRTAHQIPEPSAVRKQDFGEKCPGANGSEQKRAGAGRRRRKRRRRIRKLLFRFFFCFFFFLFGAAFMLLLKRIC